MTARDPRTISFAVRGPILRSDLPGLSDRVCRLFGGAPGGLARCEVDVHGVDADAVTVEALVRLRLVARRHACQVRLRNASPELMELVAFLGLGDVLTR